MSYRPMMEFGDQDPVGNALRFETYAEAEAAAKNLFMRWTVPSGWHVDESDDPVNYRWDPQEGLQAVSNMKAV